MDDHKTPWREPGENPFGGGGGSLFDMLFGGMPQGAGQQRQRAQGGNGGDDGNGGGKAGGGPTVNIPGVPTPITINFDKMKTPSKGKLIMWGILAVLIILALYWWFHPTLNLHSERLWYFVGFFILLPCFLYFRLQTARWTQGTAKKAADPTKADRYKHLSWIPAALVLVGLLGGVLSMSWVPGNSYKYASILQTTEKDFAQDIPEVNYNQIPVIDRDSAAILGNRTMGTIADYVSQFEISPLYSQINYQATPVRVSPLGYADIFKWLYNRKDGIPGYILVDMTTQDTELVRLPEGIKYSPSEPLGRNIYRYVQLKYPFYMFDEFAFEIDDDGTPWWVCPVQTRTIGLFGGETIVRVILCNACTGECFNYSIEEVPQWVDRAYPSDLLIRQYNWSGKYLNGWINSWLGQEGVKQTTPGTNGQLGYNYIAKDDDVWVYTGVTSATNDNSIIGFVLVNQRTAESTFYSVAGATEDSAMNSAEGQVQHLNYEATFPLLINIGGNPTYFMALKDKAGTVKKFAMLDIERYQNVAVGDTVSETQANYQQLLVTNGVLGREDVTQVLPEGDLQEATGVVTNMAQAVVDGNTHFFLMLQGQSAIFEVNVADCLDVLFAEPGDTVTISYIAGEDTYAVQGVVVVKKGGVTAG
ncbi:MAG: Tat pathway signal sequence [Coriobacteriales bacterium]|nr:Tat pathway signal sequence [Coriobacteriales bacterium]